MADNQDPQALEEAADALRKSEQRYAAFIRNSSEPIWRFELEEPVSVDMPAAEQIDAFYRLSYLAECNDAMARLYGYSHSSELVGLRLDQLMPRADPANVAYLEAFIAADYQLIDAESVEVTRDGKTKCLLNSLTAIVENGQVLRAWGTSRDMTARREADEARREYILRMESLNRTLEQRVSDRTAALSEANRHLRAFAHTVAHDLRGPARNIREFSTLLLEEHGRGLAPGAAELVSRIQRAGERMESLIASVLDYSRTLSADLKLEPIALGDTVSEIVERHHAETARAGAEIRCTGGLPVVWAHRGLLSQAVENIVTNALKFVPAGRRPQITICAERRDGRARLHVRDNGIGIAAVDRERIFEIFQRAEHDQVFVGTGIGLAIVKAAVERMGGSVGFDSTLGAGTDFWIELPTPPVA